jgi:hypothetical protein
MFSHGVFALWICISVTYYFHSVFNSVSPHNLFWHELDDWSISTARTNSEPQVLWEFTFSQSTWLICSSREQAHQAHARTLQAGGLWWCIHIPLPWWTGKDSTNSSPLKHWNELDALSINAGLWWRDPVSPDVSNIAIENVNSLQIKYPLVTMECQDDRCDCGQSGRMLW